MEYREDNPQKQPVNRGRRSLFVAAVVGFCLFSTTGIVFYGADTAVAKIAVDSMLALATFLSCAYVGASAVDYTFGQNKRDM